MTAKNGLHRKLKIAIDFGIQSSRTNLCFFSNIMLIVKSGEALKHKSTVSLAFSYPSLLSLRLSCDKVLTVSLVMGLSYSSHILCGNSKLAADED